MGTLAIDVHATVTETGRLHLDSGRAKQLSVSKKISVCQTNTAYESCSGGLCTKACNLIWLEFYSPKIDIRIRKSN